MGGRRKSMIDGRLSTHGPSAWICYSDHCLDFLSDYQHLWCSHCSLCLSFAFWICVNLAYILIRYSTDKQWILSVWLYSSFVAAGNWLVFVDDQSNPWRVKWTCLLSVVLNSSQFPSRLYRGRICTAPLCYSPCHFALLTLIAFLIGPTFSIFLPEDICFRQAATILHPFCSLAIFNWSICIFLVPLEVSVIVGCCWISTLSTPFQEFRFCLLYRL